MGTSLEPELQSILLFGNLYPSFPFNITSKLKSFLIKFVKPLIIGRTEMTTFSRGLMLLTLTLQYSKWRSLV